MWYNIYIQLVGATQWGTRGALMGTTLEEIDNGNTKGAFMDTTLENI